MKTLWLPEKFETVEYPLWREYLLFPYRVSISWWLDTLLRRPSDTVFKRAFEKKFGWFMTKHDLRSVENPCSYNLLGVLLNGKLLTLRSPTIEMRLTYLVNEFSIQVRPAHSRADWQPLSAIFDEFDRPREISWESTVTYLDNVWEQLVGGMSSLNEREGRDG